MESAEPEWYAVTGGGPLRRAERRLRITRESPRDLPREIGLVIALAYVPLLVVGVRWRIAAGIWPLAFQELANHVRPLVMLPLLLAAERLIEERARGAGGYLSRSRIVGDACRERHVSAIARTARLRDSDLVEAAFLVAVTASVFLLPAFTRDPVPAIAWSIQPGVLLYRFLAMRVLWRWLLWAFYLFQLSRMPLALRPTHPDRLAGLEPLTMPSVMFGFVVMTGAAASAAAWGDRIRFEHVPATAFTSVAITYVVVALMVSAAPLWSFTDRLIQIRHEGQRAYGALANRYSEAFERKWLDKSGEEALGDSDFQALNDIGGSFERVQRIRPVLATRGMIVTVVAAVTLPMLPLLVSQIGAGALLARLARALI